MLIRRALRIALVLAALAAVGQSFAGSNAAPKGKWRGRVDVSAAGESAGAAASDGRDAFTYHAKAVFTGNKVTGGEGTTWRGTLTWTFSGEARDDEQECKWSANGSFPVDLTTAITGPESGEHVPRRLYVRFAPEVGVRIKPVEMGVIPSRCTFTDGGYEELDEYAWALLPTVRPVTLSLPVKTKAISRTLTPRVRWRDLPEGRAVVKMKVARR